MNLDSLTPLMRQYFSIKSTYHDTIVLFQVGDFYELFFDDALTAASILGVALTKRGTYEGKPIPLCGVPLHVGDHYLRKLVKAGYKVAICDQLEAPRPGKLVDRGVTQVLTPGTLTDPKLLEEKSASYLAAFAWGEQHVTLLCAEILTGQLFVTVLSDNSSSAIESELSRFLPDEIVLPRSRQSDSWATVFQRLGYIVSYQDIADETKALEWFYTRCDEKAVAGRESTKRALTVLHSYLQRTHEQALQELTQVLYYRPEEYVHLDAATQRNLELVSNSQDGSSRHTLFSVLDNAVTSMGSRLLKKWLLRPLRSKQQIEERQQVVGLLVKDYATKETVRRYFQSIGDIERIIGRIALKRAHKHDYISLLEALEQVPHIRELVNSRLSEVSHGIKLIHMMHDFNPLVKLLRSAVNTDTQIEWLIKPGYHDELDRLRSLIEDGARAISQFEEYEQQRTGISSLKVRFNQVHGYGIEITKPNLHLVPAEYIRLQTLVNRERFTTQELKNLEYDLSRARTDISQLEKELYEALKVQVEHHVPHLKKLAYALASLDCLTALAESAYQNNYVKPTIEEGRTIHIVQGRHPVVEMKHGRKFIPNDVLLSDSSSLWIITGPNMGGKSTFLRQVALISIMTQIGSFVPATEAHLPILDRIFTRIGASDNVAEGKSTFLVEMEETALICKQATSESLVILDEVGRGTSTFDGLALAQAVVEYIYSIIKARCLFATHYHELTALNAEIDGIKPYFAASARDQQGIVLLHTILPGVADGSFGLDVAMLAGLPDHVVARARTIVAQLHVREVGVAIEPAVLSSPTTQPSVSTKDQIVAARLAHIDYDHLTPKQAFDILWDLKEQL